MSARRAIRCLGSRMFGARNTNTEGTAALPGVGVSGMWDLSALLQLAIVFFPRAVCMVTMHGR